MDKLKVGVIGVGSLGQHHARNYTEIEGVELIGISDSDKERADMIASKFNTKAFYNFEDMLDKVDAVSVVVPTTLHRKVAGKCIENNINVLVEKPITATIEESAELLELSKKYNVLLQVGHIERFNSAIMALEKKITKPVFIEVERLAPFTLRGADVSVVLDLMIHDIDIVLSLVKSKIISIDSVGCPVFTKTEDIANVRLKFENGCTVNLTSSRVSVKKTRKIRIFEPENYYSVDYMNAEINIYKKKKIDDLSKITNMIDMINMEHIKIQNEEPLALELKSFINAIEQHKKPKVSGEDGKHALEIAVEIVKNIRK